MFRRAHIRHSREDVGGGDGGKVVLEGEERDIGGGGSAGAEPVSEGVDAWAREWGDGGV
jgi:hypothetical protein